MTRILASGCSGFIGSHFLEHVLTNTDWEVVCICSWKHKGTPERIEEVLKVNPTWHERVTIITHDLEVRIPQRTKTRIGTIDYIVNFAAESHVDRSIEDPVPFIQNNVNVALTMLELAREKMPKTFIQISTDEVYGAAPEGVDYQEWASIVPSNPYSASKACQEAISISHWRTYGVPLIITNTMNNFGEMQDSEKYVAQLIRKINAGEEVTVHGTPGNVGSRKYLHARNHADAVLFLLKNTTPTMYKEGVMEPDRYNIVGDVEVSNLEMAELVSKILNKPLYYSFEDFHATRPGHDKRYSLDGRKLQALGWKPPVKFLDSMKKYIDWTLVNATWL